MLIYLLGSDRYRVWAPHTRRRPQLTALSAVYLNSVMQGPIILQRRGRDEKYIVTQPHTWGVLHIDSLGEIISVHEQLKFDTLAQAKMYAILHHTK